MNDETQRKRREAAIELVRDGMVLVGAGLVAFGAWLAWRPAGFMVAGLFLLVPAAVGALRAPRPGQGDGGGA